MRSFFILAVLLVGVGPLWGQGHVQVNNLGRINTLLDAFEQINQSTTKVDGWRVQIMATTDRQRLETVEREFKRRYPNVPVNWVHSSPYYKLRAGAFQTKLEAERLKFSLSREFDGIYLVRDQVEETELLRMY